MINQKEIHQKAHSEHAEERKEAANELGVNFAVLPDKEDAWADLHQLTYDGDSIVQQHSVIALGMAFPHIADKKLAWEDLNRLSLNKDKIVRREAVYALSASFTHIPNKKQAWIELHRLTLDKDEKVRIRAVRALRFAFSKIPDKKRGWEDLIELTRDKDFEVGATAGYTLGGAFMHLPDNYKKKAWDDLHKLTLNKNYCVRWKVADALHVAFPYIPDKKQAWEDLNMLTRDTDNIVRERAVNALGTAYPHSPDKKQAWEYLIQLTREYADVGWIAIGELGVAFPHNPDKKHAWEDIHSLVWEGDSAVRRHVADALSVAFPYIPNKQQAWEDLHRLMLDDDEIVRWHAADAIGAVFPYIPNKQQAWNELHRLIHDDNKYVRAFVNHSLGKAAILKATEAESEEDFRKNLEKALEFFERSSEEKMDFNPTNFCLPFYRSLHTIAFKKKEEEETEIQRYIIEAKKALGGSESKEKLLEVVENLANALKEVHKTKDFDGMKSNLNAYRRYSDRACELLEMTEGRAPGATKLIRKGLPIIDEKIRGIIAEIQQKTKALCKETKDTSLEELGKEVNNAGQNLLKVRDPIGLEKSVENMQTILSVICSKMPEEEGGEACELLKKAKDEPYVEDKMNLHNVILGKISSQIGEWKSMPGIQINNSIFQNSNVQIGNGNEQKIQNGLSYY